MLIIGGSTIGFHLGTIRLLIYTPQNLSGGPQNCTCIPFLPGIAVKVSSDPNAVRAEEKYPSFVEWIDERYHHFSEVHATKEVDRYRESDKFESVEMINMHEETGLLEALFCNHVPFANATCDAIRKGEIKPMKTNHGRTHEYDRLATKAFLRGKLKNYHTAIAYKVARKFEKLVAERQIFAEPSAYPKKCLNETFLEKLLQTEMEQEIKYFPKWYVSQGGDEGLRKDFGDNQEKLCSMDDERLLASGTFDSIFEELNKIEKW